MDATVESPVQAPDLSDERLEQMRAHVLGEAGLELQRNARTRKRRESARSLVSGRRRVLVVAAFALAGIYAVPAVAQERWWWISPGDDSLQPVTQVVTVGRWTEQQLIEGGEGGPAQAARFAVDGRNWMLQAFVSKQGDLCVGLSANPPWPTIEPAGFVSCGHPVRGISPAAPGSDTHWVGFGTAIAGKVENATTKIHVGPAADNVRSVDLANNDGRVIRVPTITAPQGLGVPARFWIAVLPAEHLVHTLVPRNQDGKALEHWNLPIAQ